MFVRVSQTRDIGNRWSPDLLQLITQAVVTDNMMRTLITNTLLILWVSSADDGQVGQQVAIPAVAYVASLTHTDEHLKEIRDVVLPQGRLAIIGDPVGLDTMILKPKSVSIHWEFMFTRSLFQTPDMIEQHNILNRVSELVDKGEVTTTLGENLGTITATNLKRAHVLVENGRARGKIVLEGF